MDTLSNFTSERSKQLINNLLYEICSKTDLPIEQYEDWLVDEVGFSQKEISELKEANCFPEPEIYSYDLIE